MILGHNHVKVMKGDVQKLRGYMFFFIRVHIVLIVG